MSESKETKGFFLGTYFERDSVLRLSRIADIFGWVSLFIYGGQVLLSLTIMALQLARGLIHPVGMTDFAQQILWIVYPITPGLWYFVGFQGVGRLLLILMDIEDSLRRAARK